MWSLNYLLLGNLKVLIAEIILFVIISALAVLRYILGRPIVIEQVFYTLCIFVITFLIGHQLLEFVYVHYSYRGSMFATKMGSLYHGLGFGGGILLYCLLMIFAFIMKCMRTKVNNIQIEKDNTIKIMPSSIWKIVGISLNLGILILWLLCVLPFLIGNVKNGGALLGWFVLILVTPLLISIMCRRLVQGVININVIKSQIIQAQTKIVDAKLEVE
ncbi:hypothetical protein [uncultured Lactobacillus sp.]|uniref:hypothetical protein n=1 Tax=uncultured Lactobacillus sp. TaxID=153152 RepID=UPI00262C0F88|nr:hypothetical protein [uncultured Lactobacillus sp.]